MRGGWRMGEERRSGYRWWPSYGNVGIEYDGSRWKGSPRQRILVVEDDRRLQGLLHSMLEGASFEPDVVGTASEALELLERREPSVAVVDLGLPDLDGTELIRALQSKRPGLPVLVLSVVSSEQRIVGAIRAGAVGYLFKEDLITKLIPAIFEALAGGFPLSDGAGRALLSELRRSPGERGNSEGPKSPAAGAPVLVPSLTRREQAVLEKLGEGFSYQEIGAQLGISLNTVRTHVRVIYEKLGVCSKTEAVRFALRLGLLSLGDS